MDEDVLEKLRSIKNIEDFIKYIEPYYPDLKVSEYTIENIEKSLNNFYIKLIGRIISFSPINMRFFLKDFLLKFEIKNIKQIIIGQILGLTNEEITQDLNFLVEDYLENTDFIKKLIEKTTIEEIPLFFQKTLYHKAVKEGLLYFKNYKEIFVLEAFLDRLYFQNLIKRERSYGKNEKKMIHLFNALTTEIYNINLIHRGILNKIDKNLLSQLIIDNYFFLDRRLFELILDSGNLEFFFKIIDENLRKKVELRYYINSSESEHLTWMLEKLYYRYYFSKFKQDIEDIEFMTIYKIMQVVIQKEAEIKFEIIPNIVNIIHKKYDLLKSR